MDAALILRTRGRYLSSIALGCALLTTAHAASFRTQNFIIQAPSPQLARSVGEAAERYRHDLAVYWLGQPLRPWPAPCPVRVVAGPHLAAQGVTTYNPAPVRDFQMEVIGSPERILDSVLPHEVTHTVLATHFGRPLPRWADEGICTTVEHDSERSKHEAKLREFLRSRRGIPMNQLFLMTEYPNDVLPLYAQGYSVCQFLIAQKGPRGFIDFLHDYIQHPSWTANVRKHYQYESLAELQQYWVDWVAAGSGPVDRFAKVQLASQTGDAGDRIAQVAATAPAGSAPGAAVVTAAAPRTASPTAPAHAAAGRSTTPGVALAALAGTDSWYQRRRLQGGQAEETPGQRVPAIRPLAPPSVRNSGRYQSAQPQGERGVRRPALLR